MKATQWLIIVVVLVNVARPRNSGGLHLRHMQELVDWLQDDPMRASISHDRISNLAAE